MDIPSLGLLALATKHLFWFDAEDMFLEQSRADVRCSILRQEASISRDHSRAWHTAPRRQLWYSATCHTDPSSEEPSPLHWINAGQSGTFGLLFPVDIENDTCRHELSIGDRQQCGNV